MKYILSSIILLFVACTSTKTGSSAKPPVANASTSQEKPKEPVGNPAIITPPKEDVKFYNGIVHLTSEGCGVYIAVGGGEIADFYPVNLDAKYKVQGTKLKFQATFSRAKSPEGCMILPMSIDMVTLVK
jgi:hypothetical protein